MEASKKQLVQQPPPIPQSQPKNNSKEAEQEDGSKKGSTKVYYVQERCNECKLPGQIRVDHASGQICEECLAAKSKIGLKIPEKHEGPVTRSSKKV
jgi:hypothetical protein